MSDPWGTGRIDKKPGSSLLTYTGKSSDTNTTFVIQVADSAGNIYSNISPILISGYDYSKEPTVRVDFADKDNFSEGDVVSLHISRYPNGQHPPELYYNPNITVE